MESGCALVDHVEGGMAYFEDVRLEVMVSRFWDLVFQVKVVSLSYVVVTVFAAADARWSPMCCEGQEV